MNELLNFPGTPLNTAHVTVCAFLSVPGHYDASPIFQIVVIILLEVVAYLIALQWLRHFIAPTTPAKHAFGKLIGMLLGIYAATFYARAVEAHLRLDPELITLFVIFAAVGNAVLTSHVFTAHTGGHR